MYIVEFKARTRWNYFDTGSSEIEFRRRSILFRIFSARVG